MAMDSGCSRDYRGRILVVAESASARNGAGGYWREYGSTDDHRHVEYCDGDECAHVGDGDVYVERILS